MRLTAAITKDGDWFVAQCLEVDVASQGRSVEEARANLAEALALHFEDQDAEIGEAPIIAPVDVAVFEQISQRGSHVKLRSPAGRTAIVPNHTEIARARCGRSCGRLT